MEEIFLATYILFLFIKLILEELVPAPMDLMEILLVFGSGDEPKIKKRKFKKKYKMVSHQFFWEIDVPRWPEDTFRQQFRISTRTFNEICENIAIHVEKQNNFCKTTIPIAKRVAICIYFLKSGADYSVVGNSFGVSKSSVFNIVSDVCDGIIETFYRSKIKFPKTEVERREVADGFLMKTHFPGCLGAIDGSHIPIIAPEFGHCDYYNYKGWYSTILLAVADFKYRFTYIHVGSPGKIHDAGVFHSSALKRRINEGLIPTEYHILGDGAFPLSDPLLKPYPGINLSEDQKLFNKSMSSARVAVENAFGRLKGRWRILLTESRIRDFKKTIKIITTCCILHNICEDNNEFYDIRWSEAVQEFERNFAQPDMIAYAFDTSDGILKRDSILEYIKNF